MISFLWTFGFSIILMASTTNAGSKLLCGNFEKEENIANKRRENQITGIVKRKSYDSIKIGGSITTTHDELQEVNIEETELDEKNESYIESSISLNDIVITNVEEGSIKIPKSNGVQLSQLGKSIDENQNNKKDENYIEPSISLRTDIVITNDIGQGNISNEVQPFELEKKTDEIVAKQESKKVANDLKKAKEDLITSQQQVKELQTQLLNKNCNENTSSEDGKKLKTNQDAPNEPISTKNDSNSKTEEDTTEINWPWEKITLGACVLSITLNFILCYSFAHRKKITTIVTQIDDEEPQMPSLDSVTRSALNDQNIRHQHFSRSESYSPDEASFRAQSRAAFCFDNLNSGTPTSSEHSPLKLVSPILENNEDASLKMDVISVNLDDIEHSPLELDFFSPMLENNEE